MNLACNFLHFIVKNVYKGVILLICNSSGLLLWKRHQIIVQDFTAILVSWSFSTKQKTNFYTTLQQYHYSRAFNQFQKYCVQLLTLSVKHDSYFISVAHRCCINTCIRKYCSKKMCPVQTALLNCLSRTKLAFTACISLTTGFQAENNL